MGKFITKSRWKILLLKSYATLKSLKKNIEIKMKKLQIVFSRFYKIDLLTGISFFFISRVIMGDL